jgi:hypothetical protein
MSDFPVPIPNPGIIVPRLDTQTKLNLGGIWGEIGASQTVLASDGKRFIWSANGLNVVYSSGGRFYSQSAQGFANEIRTAPIIVGARGAEFMARVAEVEMKLMMGIVAGASGLGFAAVVGTEVAQFTVENRNNFAKWSRWFKAFLQAREILQNKVPRLYDKVFNAILDRVWKDWKSKLSGGVTAEIVAFGVGVILGSAGKAAAEGAFSLLKVALVVLEQIVIRFSLGVAPTAFLHTTQEYRKFAESLLSALRGAGIALNDADVQAIVTEVKRSPNEVKRAFEILKAGFGQ